jgi:hypothetical protein
VLTTRSAPRSSSREGGDGAGTRTRRLLRVFRAWVGPSGAGEVVVDVFLALIAKERHNLPGLPVGRRHFPVCTMPDFLCI